MDKTTFHQASQSAILDAQTARLTLARDHAKNFIHGDTQFDPNILQRLGSAGISLFIKEVRAHGVALTHSPAPDRTYKSETSIPVDGGARAILIESRINTGFSCMSCMAYPNKISE